MRRAFLASCIAFAGASLVVAHGGRGSENGGQPHATDGGFSCVVASITDGDTLRCADGRRVRLSGIDARERDGSCGVGRSCVDAGPQEATAELRRLAEGQRLSCRAVGTSYGRTAAFCVNEAGEDLSCAMVASGTVARWERYMKGHRC